MAKAQSVDISHELGKIKVKELVETSGVAASRQNPFVLWLHNDGDGGRLYGVRTSGKLAAVVESPVKVDDVEDISLGPGPGGRDYLYLGDIGDNSERRPSVRVVRFAEPVLEGRGSEVDAESAEKFQLEYPDAPHDAEALFVDPVDGDLFIVTKERGRARVFSAAAEALVEGKPVAMELAATLDVGDVSAAAISPDGRRILMRQEAEGWLWDRGDGETVAAALGRKPREVPVRGKRQGPNGESISFSADGNSYYTVSEGKKQSIYEFDLPATGAGER